MALAVPPPLVVVGGSAGALQPLRQIVAALPADFSGAVCVAIHLPHDSPSALARLLSAAGPLDAAFGEDGAELLPGSIRVAPPGRHLLVHDGHIALSPGARENGARPAIDPLFRSAARAAGPRVVSVLLSGTLDDGAAGTAAIRRAGGITIVQDPEDAEFGDMPDHAIATGAVMRVLTAEAIAQQLADVVTELAVLPVPLPSDAVGSVDRGLAGPATDLPGTPSPYSCPACGGVLYPRNDDSYLCRLGHRYSPRGLAKSQLDVVEDALWTALRSLEEAASLCSRVYDRAIARGDLAMARRFDERRIETEGRAGRIRALLGSTVAGEGFREAASDPQDGLGDGAADVAEDPAPEFDRAAP